MKLDLWDFFDWECDATDYMAMIFGEDDVDELIKHSYWRRAFLARYGRQNMLQWDHVPVDEMNRLLQELIGILNKENELSRMD